MIAIEEVGPAFLPDVRRLLERAKLPVAGLDALDSDGLPGHVLMLVARDRADIVGSAALEEYPGGALLRSVAVDEAFRGQGLGQRLTQAALGLARRRGHRVAYLLTTTAGGFFPRFGFAAVERAEVPADVRASVEFTSACPSSAIVMRAPLGAG